MIVGYARVSTDGQTLDAQQAALREAGATSVFSEKVSGAKTDRAALAKPIAALAVGDTPVVCKLDSWRDQCGLIEHLGRYCRRWRNVQVVGRSLVRHYKCARQALTAGEFNPQ